MRNRSRLAGIAALVLAVSALAGGCGGSETEAGDASGGAGNSVGSEDGGAKLPDNFPDDIPVPASYEVQSVNDSDDTLLVRVSVLEAPEDLASQLSEGLAASGYTLDDPVGADSRLVSAEGHNRSVHITLSSSGDITLVSYTVMAD